MSNELTIIEEIKNPALVFVPNGLDGFLKRIEDHAKAEISKVSTIEEAKSVRYGLKKTKTSLDKLGKDLGAEYREKIAVFNAERGRAVEFVEALEVEIYAPWKALEDAEKSRVEAHEKALADMAVVGSLDPLIEVNATYIQDRLQQLPALYQRDWQEFAARAMFEHNNLQTALNTRLEARKKHEAEQAELVRLRAEEAARAQKEREDKIASEAAAKAKKDAEDKAAIEAAAAAKREAASAAALVQAEADKKAAVEKAEKDRAAAVEAAAKAKKDAEDKAAIEAAAAAKREAASAAALVQAEADKKAAAEKAEKDRAAAVEAAAKAERDRQAAEKAAEEKAAAAREADKAHRAKINNEALQAMLTVFNEIKELSPESHIKGIIGAIARGEIPHVKISY